jgi:tRNA(Ile)-lysidine synthase
VASHPAVERVARFAQSEKLFRRAKNLLVAISGGPDSLALLFILAELRERFGLELSACHFDHQLRPDSRADLEFVREICERQGISCLTGEGDVRALARQQHIGIEEAARRMRYQFLSFVAAEKRVDALVTGHTADDQAETVLMRVLRGTGVRGLRGMVPDGVVPGAPAQRLLRPILCLSREETAAFCRDRGLAPRSDPSNTDVDFLRNRLRLETIPTLSAINPSVKDALLGLAESARQLFAGVERESFSVQPVARTPVGAVFERAPLAALQAEALILVIEREASFFKLQPGVNRTRVNNLRNVLQRGSGVVLFGDIAVEASCGKVRVGPPLAPEAIEGRILNIPGATPVGPWRVDVSTGAFSPTPGATLTSLAADALEGALRARPLEHGDRIRYHGIERKVADVFANAKLPSWERVGALAIADSVRVHAVLTANAAIEADRPMDADCWHVRVAELPRPVAQASPMLTSGPSAPPQQ